MPLPSDKEFMQRVLIDKNKQLLDANKMLHALLCALLLQKHNGATVLESKQVEKNFNNYNVKWTPVVEGSNFFEIKAEPVVRVD